MERQLTTSPQLMKILRAFLEDPDEWFLGDALAKTTALKPTVMYPILNRLGAQGFIETEREEKAPKKGRPPRVLYRLTETGLEMAYEAPLAYQSQWKASARRKLRRQGT